MIALALSHLAAVRLAEVGFLLFSVAGVWLVTAEVLGPRWTRLRHVVTGCLLAVGGFLLIGAVHSGALG